MSQKYHLGLCCLVALLIAGYCIGDDPRPRRFLPFLPGHSREHQTNWDQNRRASRPYFNEADWLWDPICLNPVLDQDSAQMVARLKDDYHGANLWAFGVTLRGPDGITAQTPLYKVTFTMYPGFESSMPIPDGTPIPPGNEIAIDGHVAIADASTPNKAIFNLWQAKNQNNVWSASGGAMTPMGGDGRELKGSSTGAGIARYAAVVRVSEIKAGHIPHALFFATDMASSGYRYPAVKSDGTNTLKAPVPIPEGARVQLDPSIDVEAIQGITKFEKTIAKALQTYGAYCGDNGGARMAIICEFEGGPNPPGKTYIEAGATVDYFKMAHIPWDKLRVLHSWDGK